MSKVSVVLPVYNVERYLSACLDSILGQTLEDIEVIAVDDCSPDRCGAILDEYAAKDRRVQVIHLQENRRQGYGRNRGLERATGDYVYFLDSDDMIESETLLELSALADEEELDAVFFDSRDVFESEELRKVYQPPFELRRGTYRDGVYEGKELLDAFMRQNEWTCYPQRILWRRSFLLKEGVLYPEGIEHEDEYFAFAGILTARRVRYVPKQYFLLRVRPNSVMTSRPAPKNFHGYLMNFYYMNRFLVQRGLNTYGAQTNVLRMLERVLTLYQTLQEEDLESMFVKEPDRTVYDCFMSCILAQDLLYRIDEEVLEQIRDSREVFIYGARLTGERFCEKLERQQDIVIGGVIAQFPEDAGRIVRGRRVQSLDEIRIPEDAVVVAAVKVMYWEETRKMMEEKRIRCVYHRKL